MSTTTRPANINPLSSPPVPEVLTERLRLRGHQLNDFEHFAAMQGDPEVMRYITGRGLERDECWQKFARHPGHWSMRGFGYWVATDRESGEFLGEAGFADMERVIEPSFRSFLEAGWIMKASAQGRGLATEAMLGALNWAGQQFPDATCVCMIDHANTGSVRVAEKIGFQPWIDAVYKKTPVKVYRRPARLPTGSTPPSVDRAS